MSAPIEVLVNGLDHPECVVIDATGTLWAGGESGQIYRIDPVRKTFEQVASTDGFCLGIQFAPNGGLWICDVGHKALYELRDGSVSCRLKQVQGQPLETPNYIVFQRDGTGFFSDSGRWRQDDGRLCVLLPDGSARVLASELAFPNGLALSADEHYLYVVESTEDRVIRYEILADKSLAHREIVVGGVSHVPDGLAFDPEGRLYVSCYARDVIYRLSRGGELEVVAEDPDRTLLAAPTNCVTSLDGRTLYAANLGRWHISSIAL